MISFNEIHYLWLLIPIPILIILFYFGQKNRTQKNRKLISSTQWSRLVPVKWWKGLRYVVWIPVALLIIALAEPRLGTNLDAAEKASLDIVIAVDVSESMLAEDVYPNRLEAVKRAIFALLERLNGDRVALVAFAGNAYPQMPLTSDYGSVRLFSESLSPDIAPFKGTNLNRAIEVSMSMFDSEVTDNRTIFILSDGENHEDSAIVSAKKARESGVIVNVASVGKENGSGIPIYKDGVQVGWKMDKSGNQVLSTSNPEFLKELAAQGGGNFVEGSDPVSALLKLYKSTDDMPRLPRESIEVKNNANRYLWLLWPAFIAMVVFFLMNKRWSLKSKSLILLLGLLIPFEAFAQHPNAVFREGVSAYKNGDFKKSIEIFKTTSKNKELSTKSKYNLAAAYYKAGMPDSAISMIQNVAVSNDKSGLQSKAWYNLGNSFLSQQNYAKAVEAYAQSLRLDPTDENARYNLTYALQKLQQKQQEQKQEQQKQNQDQQKDQQQNAKQEEKPLDKNNANEEVLKLLENREKDKRKNSIPQNPIRPDKDW